MKNTKYNTQDTKHPAGFTLIETLIAILILTLSITGPLTIASRGLDTALSASDQVTATYLAQDAVEYVQWVADSNALRIHAQAGTIISDPNQKLNSNYWLYGFYQNGARTCLSADGNTTCRFDTRFPLVNADGSFATADDSAYCGQPNLTFSQPFICTTNGNACTVPLFYGDGSHGSGDTSNGGFNYVSSNVGAFYNYDCGTLSKFIRTVSIQTPVNGNNDEARVTATVNWTNSIGFVSGTAGLHKVVVVEDIFNFH